MFHAVHDIAESVWAPTRVRAAPRSTATTRHCAATASMIATWMPMLFAACREARSLTVSGIASVLPNSKPWTSEEAMPTQLKLFSAREPEEFFKLEKEVNDWLAAKGDSIQPVNSQTATCAIAVGGDDKQSQAV